MSGQAGTAPASRQEGRPPRTYISTAPPETLGLSSLPSPWALYTLQALLDTWVLTCLRVTGRGHVAPAQPHRGRLCTHPVWAGVHEGACKESSHQYSLASCSWARNSSSGGLSAQVRPLLGGRRAW